MKEIIIKKKNDITKARLKDEDKSVDWTELSKEDRIEFLDMLKEMYDLFNRYIKC